MTRPKRTCTEPGCPVLVTKGYCLRHNRNRRLREGQSARAPAQRETMRKYDRRWRKLRLIVLGRDPICQSCKAAPSTEVDHIVPRDPTQHAADVTEEELQGLCKPCHSTKTWVENRAKSKAGVFDRDWDYGKAEQIAVGGGNPVQEAHGETQQGDQVGAVPDVSVTGAPSPKPKRRRKLPKDDA